jgi:hypothetical protein
LPTWITFLNYPFNILHLQLKYKPCRAIPTLSSARVAHLAVDIGFWAGPPIPISESGFGSSVLLLLRGWLEGAQLVRVLQVAVLETLVRNRGVFFIWKFINWVNSKNYKLFLKCNQTQFINENAEYRNHSVR